MNKLIPITENNGEIAISARHLYSFLKVKDYFTQWATRMFEYGFTEGIDYQPSHIFVESSSGIGGTSKLDYALTVDCAKHISMIQRTPQGKAARDYFIETEKEFKKQQSTKHQIPTSFAEALMLAAKQAAQLELSKATITKLTPKADLMDRVMDTDTLIDIGQVAKVLQLPFGRNKLFKALRELGIFFKTRNEPKQQYIDAGYFFVKQELIDNKKCEPFIVLKVRVTQRGLAFISKQFNIQTKPLQMAIFDK